MNWTEMPQSRNLQAKDVLEQSLCLWRTLPRLRMSWKVAKTISSSLRGGMYDPARCYGAQGVLVHVKCCTPLCWRPPCLPQQLRQGQPPCSEAAWESILQELPLDVWGLLDIERIRLIFDVIPGYWVATIPLGSLP